MDSTKSLLLLIYLLGCVVYFLVSSHFVYSFPFVLTIARMKQYNSMCPTTARVIRDGRILILDAADLVVGDIVVFYSLYYHIDISQTRYDCSCWLSISCLYRPYSGWSFFLLFWKSYHGVLFFNVSLVFLLDRLVSLLLKPPICFIKLICVLWQHE